jgi:CheY-like chemotaxis protein
MTGPRILIVDDNVMTIELLSFVLSEDEFEVESAERALEALEKISTFHPDLILMDMHMPGMSGLELTQLIKANPAMQHILIIAFTASAMKGDETRMMAAGCNGYLSKPIDVDTFAASVLAFLPAR